MTITKETTTSLSKDISNSIKNDTFENRDDLNDSENLETRGFKYGSKIGSLKDNKNYVSGNDGDNFQEKVIENIFEN